MCQNTPPNKREITSWPSKGKSGSFVFTPYFVDDAWGASVGTHKKEGDPGEDDCHIRDVAGKQHRLVALRSCRIKSQNAHSVCWLAQVLSSRPRTSWVKAQYWSFNILQLCPVLLLSLLLPGMDSPLSTVVETAVTEKARVQRTRSDSK
jgi:hypothetical protein